MPSFAFIAHALSLAAMGQHRMPGAAPVSRLPAATPASCCGDGAPAASWSSPRQQPTSNPTTPRYCCHNHNHCHHKGRASSASKTLSNRQSASGQHTRVRGLGASASTHRACRGLVGAGAQGQLLGRLGAGLLRAGLLLWLLLGGGACGSLLAGLCCLAPV